MKTASVGEIQRNFAKVLRSVEAGAAVTVTRRGRPVARITPLRPQVRIDWPDFFDEVLELPGEPLSEIVDESREDRL